MSLYADYVQERTDDLVLETDQGFVQYRFLNDGETVYIIDIFVPKHLRAHGMAAALADAVCAEAKGRGFKTLLGTVRPSAHGSTDSLKVLLGYGMKLTGAEADAIFFKKEL